MAEAPAKRRANVLIGPQHNGRRLSFARFQRAETVPGYLYELAAGVIEVTDVPGRDHALVLQAIEEILYSYKLGNAGVIEHLSTGAFAKTEMPILESERHPDYSIYLTPMPDDDYPWDKWVPSIAIEVASLGAKSRKRDYVTKRREYLAAGILEYWVVDPQTRSMLALTRHGDSWRERKLAARGNWSTPLLPGFTLKLAPVFAVLDRRGK